MKPIDKFYIKPTWRNQVGGLTHIKDTDRIEVENIPLAGFRFDGFRITDPRGFTVDLSPSNITLIVNNCTIKNGIILNKMYYFLENNRSIRLDIYNEMVEKVVQKKINELEIGDIMHDGSVYLGKARVVDYQSNYCLYANRTFKHVIRHCFLQKEEETGKPFIHSVTNSVIDYAVIDHTDEYKDVVSLFEKENSLEDDKVKVDLLFFPVESKITSTKIKINSKKEWNEELEKMENVLYSSDLDIRLIPRTSFYITPWDRNKDRYLSYRNGSRAYKDCSYIQNKSFIEKTYIEYNGKKFRLI